MSVALLSSAPPVGPARRAGPVPGKVRLGKPDLLMRMALFLAVPAALVPGALSLVTKPGGALALMFWFVFAPDSLFDLFPAMAHGGQGRVHFLTISPVGATKFLFQLLHLFAKLQQLPFLGGAGRNAAPGLH